MTAGPILIGATLNRSALAYQFVAVAKELLARGRQVAFVSPWRRVSAADGVDVPVYFWPSERPTRLRDGVFAWKLMRRLRPECVISNFGASTWLLMTSWAARVPMRAQWYHTMISAIDLDCGPPSPLIHFLKLRKASLLYGLATHIVAVSAAARADVIQRCHLPASKCHLLYNAIADPGLDGTAAPEARIVCAARLAPCKGQDVLIRAFARVAARFPAVKLELLGSGPAEADYRALAASLGIAPRCSFRGEVAREVVLREVARSGIFVLPSRSDNCPMALIEALAVGKPVIATTVGGIPEIVRDGQDGLLVPPDDPAALAEKLETMLSSAEVRAGFARRARERFLSAFEVGVAARRQADWVEIELERRVSSHPKRGARKTSFDERRPLVNEL